VSLRDEPFDLAAVVLKAQGGIALSHGERHLVRSRLASDRWAEAIQSNGVFLIVGGKEEQKEAIVSFKRYASLLLEKADPHAIISLLAFFDWIPKRSIAQNSAVRHVVFNAANSDIPICRIAAIRALRRLADSHDIPAQDQLNRLREDRDPLVRSSFQPAGSGLSGGGGQGAGGGVNA